MTGSGKSSSIATTKSMMVPHLSYWDRRLWLLARSQKVVEQPYPVLRLRWEEGVGRVDRKVGEHRLSCHVYRCEVLGETTGWEWESTYQPEPWGHGFLKQ